MDRKQFILRTFQFTAGSFLVRPLLAEQTQQTMSEPMIDGNPTKATTFAFGQVKLPYAYDALEPHIDAKTMEIHYMKHHAAYVKKVTQAIEDENITANSAKEFFSKVSTYSANARNNGGGAWNHNLYWEVMKPGGAEAPTGKLLDAINGTFDSFDNFKKQFTEMGMKRFGSGWAWLVTNNGKLEVGSTPSQDNPLMDVGDFHGTPLLGMDVWEHAYYLKYQNKRDEYIQNWWDVVNWDAVTERLG